MKFKEFNYEIPQVALDFGFEDTSWHNDVSAAMTHEGLNLMLWVAEPVAETREYPEQPRFQVYTGDYETMSEMPVFSTESEEGLRVYLSGLTVVPPDAKAVLDRIHGWLGDQYTISDRAMCDQIMNAINEYYDALTASKREVR